MKIVIEIPDNEYHQICELRLHNRTFYDDAIRNGTPLPKTNYEVLVELFGCMNASTLIESVTNKAWLNEEYRIGG